MLSLFGRLLVLSSFLSACGFSQSSLSSSKDLQDENLWAGLTSSVSARGGIVDECDGNRNLFDTNPISFSIGGNMTYQNVCFQVWVPGVTDTGRLEDARKLDVKIHYNIDGIAYDRSVNVFDKQGNNLRYKLSAYDFHPYAHLFYTSSFLSFPYPLSYRIEGDVAVFDKRTVPFYFTVNGKKLLNSQNKPFTLNAGSFTKSVGLSTRSDSDVVTRPIMECNDGKVVVGHISFERESLQVDFYDPAMVDELSLPSIVMRPDLRKMGPISVASFYLTDLVMPTRSGQLPLFQYTANLIKTRQIDASTIEMVLPTHTGVLGTTGEHVIALRNCKIVGEL